MYSLRVDPRKIVQKKSKDFETTVTKKIETIHVLRVLLIVKMVSRGFLLDIIDNK